MHTTEVGVTVTVTVEEGVAAGTAEGERCRTGLLGSVGSERTNKKIRAEGMECGAVLCGARCGRKSYQCGDKSGADVRHVFFSDVLFTPDQAS